MLTLEEAQERILGEIHPMPREIVAVESALGRVLAERVIAPIDLPLFDNSAMDGYAVRAADVAGASQHSPVPLKWCGRIEAGETPSLELISGSSVRIFTGLLCLPARMR